jgi:hypothetical protein
MIANPGSVAARDGDRASCIMSTEALRGRSSGGYDIAATQRGCALNLPSRLVERRNSHVALLDTARAFQL